MKKLFVAASLLVASLSVNAQDGFTSKNGHQVLPEAGDYGISFEANPFLNYVGNIFNTAGTTAPTPNFPSSGAITVRKFIDANTAYRGMLRLDLGSTTEKANVADDVSTDPNATVEDKYSAKNTNIIIGAGLEKRRGNSRVQGIYGAMVTIAKTGSKDKFEYGNAITSTNTAPTSNNFNGNVAGGTRTLEEKTSSGFGFGVLGFVGAEFFLAPKLSIGAEFQWGPSINLDGKLETTTEAWNGTAVETTTTETAGGSSIGFNTGVTAINLNFFF